MTAEFVTKRPHKKSRGGCQTCKSKRIKCNEAQPKCSFCEKRKFTCLYVNKPTRPNSPPGCNAESNSSDSEMSLISTQTPPSSIGSFEDISRVWSPVNAPRLPVVNTSVGALSQIDLCLIHHWSTVTWDTIVVGDESASVLLIDVPQLAFENDYLLNCLLGISSLHREQMYPTSEEHRQLTAAYRVKALNGFRNAIANASTQPFSWEAGLTMSILLLALCSKDYTKKEEDLTIINWLIFYRGLHAVIGMKSYERIRETRLYPIFRRELVEVRESPAIPTVLIKLLEGITLLDSDFEHLQSYCTVLDSLGVLYASLKQDGVSPELWIRVVSWPSFTDEQFTTCAKERRPRALIMLTYYLCFVKLVKGLWWLDDLADKEINMIAQTIDSDWLPFMAIPLEASRMTNKEDVARFLLS